MVIISLQFVILLLTSNYPVNLLQMRRNLLFSTNSSAAEFHADFFENWGVVSGTMSTEIPIWGMLIFELVDKLNDVQKRQFLLLHREQLKSNFRIPTNCIPFDIF